MITRTIRTHATSVFSGRRSRAYHTVVEYSRFQISTHVRSITIVALIRGNNVQIDFHQMRAGGSGWKSHKQSRVI